MGQCREPSAQPRALYWDVPYTSTQKMTQILIIQGPEKPDSGKKKSNISKKLEEMTQPNPGLAPMGQSFVE